LVWLGFYENAFRLMREAYRELGRELDQPLATFEEAFKPSNFVVLEEEVDGKWIPWVINFPMNNEVPGEPCQPKEIEEYIHSLIEFAYDYYNSSFHKIFDKEEKPDENVFKEFISDIADTIGDIGLDIGGKLLFSLLQLTRKIADKGNQSKFLDGLVQYLDWLWKKVEARIESDDEARRLWITVNLILSNVRGIIRDEIAIKGFESIDDLDYREWIAKHGASDITVNSGLVQGIYSINFSGKNVHTFAAGTALKGTLRMLFDYKGSIFHRMQAGMGDAIMTPFYELLKKRGVKFQFFHKVENLKVGSDGRGKFIQSVKITKQANLKNDEYDPLVQVKRLPSWPSIPNYEQLKEGDELKKKGIDLEDFWSEWKGVDSFDLVAGKHYDRLILGISIGAFPYITTELVESSPSWKSMIENVTTTITGAFQFWTFPDRAGLGWSFWKEEPPTLTSFAQPIDTWADLSDLLGKEDWSSDFYPGAISYFCGGLQDSVLPLKPEDKDYVKSSQKYIKDLAVWFTQNQLPYLFPNLKDKSQQIRWNLLVDPKERKGESRIESQYLRINVQPSERYVLSPKGSTKFRIKTDGSDFKNLILTGDWVYNEVLNAGCVETTVVSGIQAANVVLSQKVKILGKDKI
jgi:uncharacterized protein with NAD-binding domain and iron-sulfur cluster